MHKLQRITTLYAEDEDRILIAGEGQDQSVQTLWLSRRLLDRLVPRLTGWLQSQVGSAQADVVQSFAQDAAFLALTPEPAVDPAKACESWLVKSIDVTTSPNDVRLIFNNHAHQAELVMHQHFLRQWLIILHGQYQLASWDVLAWPGWLTSPENGAPEHHKWH